MRVSNKTPRNARGGPAVGRKTEKGILCPFCGKNGAIDTLNYAGGSPAKFRVQCQGCKASTGWHDTEEKAREAWGKREAGIRNPVRKK